MKTNYQKTALLMTILLILMAAGCLIWIISGCRGDRSDSITADIYQEGRLIQSIRLDTVTEPYTFVITGSGGCRNEVEVRPGSIGIISADCPDRLCVHQGFISTSLLPITCLPNRVVIRIRTGETDAGHSAEPDIVTY